MRLRVNVLKNLFCVLMCVCGDPPSLEMNRLELLFERLHPLPHTRILFLAQARAQPRTQPRDCLRCDKQGLKKAAEQSGAPSPLDVPEPFLVHSPVQAGASGSFLSPARTELSDCSPKTPPASSKLGQLQPGLRPQRFALVIFPSFHSIFFNTPQTSVHSTFLSWEAPK